MLSGLLCDLCAQTDSEHVRMARYYIEADIETVQIDRRGRNRRAIISIEMDVCRTCMEKKHPRIVKLKTIREYVNPLEQET